MTTTLPTNCILEALANDDAISPALRRAMTLNAAAYRARFPRMFNQPIRSADEAMHDQDERDDETGDISHAGLEHSFSFEPTAEDYLSDRASTRWEAMRERHQP